MCLLDATYPLQTGAEGFPIAAALFTVGLAAVHLLGGRIQFGKATHRRRWVSAAGGASVAYVFVLLLPEVSEAALLVGEHRQDALWSEQLVYLFALTGFVVFYGVETVVAQRTGESVERSEAAFWFHVAVFALYSAVIGYLLFHQEVPGWLNLLLYALAMALHLEVTDYGLRRHHGPEFDRTARWILAAATVLGGLAGALTEVVGLGLTVLFGFLAGAVVLNVVKEELPVVEESRFLAFVAGALVYALVVLLV